MTTGQLIVLWYAALAIATILIYKSIELSGDNPYLIYSVITLASVLIYTMREHARANKKLVFASVSAPFATGVILAVAYQVWSDNQSRIQVVIIPVSQIQIEEFRVSNTFPEVFRPEIIGKVRNSSSLTLKSVSVKYKFTNGSQASPQYSALINASVEPSHSTEFNTPISDAIGEYLNDEKWTGTEVEVVEATGTRTGVN